MGLLQNRDAVEPLLAALKDPAALVRYQAANALGALGQPKAYPALNELAHSDPDLSVRNAANAAAKRIRPQTTIEPQSSP
jgi:HEAT repeat protein